MALTRPGSVKSNPPRLCKNNSNDDSGGSAGAFVSNLTLEFLSRARSSGKCMAMSEASYISTGDDTYISGP